MCTATRVPARTTTASKLLLRRLVSQLTSSSEPELATLPSTNWPWLPVTVDEVVPPSALEPEVVVVCAAASAPPIAESALAPTTSVR